MQGIGMTSSRTRARLIAQLREHPLVDDRVLEVMSSLPRHIFVDEALASRAYEDNALPIGHGQTISRPYTVALMSSLILDGRPLDRVLEIGTGCGYQTAILAALCGRVYTMERIQPLLTGAKKRLVGLRCTNISYRLADGSIGWPEQAPFDAILTTAAAPELPLALREQLAVGGSLVIPVGAGDRQELHRITRTDGAEFQEEVVEAVRFVPLVSGEQ
jgi:protein-L-isoaspartate(D-aspartate) O-methyltransferase